MCCRAARVLPVHGPINAAPPHIPPTADSSCAVGVRNQRDNRRTRVLTVDLTDVTMPRHHVVPVLHDEPARVSLPRIRRGLRGCHTCTYSSSCIPQTARSILILSRIVPTHDSPDASLIARPASHSHIDPPPPT
jgi:hypothetical protein